MAGRRFDIGKVVNAYVAVLEKNGIHPLKVILYGSYAKGTATQLSDIDIVIVSEDLARWEPLPRLEMLSRLTAAIDAPLEVLGYTPNEIASAGRNSILWAEIEKSGKILLAA